MEVHVGMDRATPGVRSGSSPEHLEEVGQTSRTSGSGW